MRTEYRVLPAFLIVAVTLPALAGCMAGGEGEVTVYVKDAPTDEWSHINVTFTRVAVHQGEDEAAEDDAGWITLVDETRTVDLLAFRGEDARAFLGDESLEAGVYNQVRIDVSEATGVRADSGEEVTFSVSSGSLRLVRAFNVTAGETTRVILDFDLDREGVLVQQGRAGWRFTPVVGTVIVQEDVEADKEDVPADGA